MDERVCVVYGYAMYGGSMIGWQTVWRSYVEGPRIDRPVHELEALELVRF